MRQPPTLPPVAREHDGDDQHGKREATAAGTRRIHKLFVFVPEFNVLFAHQSIINFNRYGRCDKCVLWVPPIDGD